MVIHLSTVFHSVLNLEINGILFTTMQTLAAIQFVFDQRQMQTEIAYSMDVTVTRTVTHTWVQTTVC